MATFGGRTPGQRAEHWRKAAIIGYFLLFCLFLLVCNRGDWDPINSMAEVDRRSWLLEHVPPLWTYQFCGGVSRVGNPASFGLSPLFGLVLLFGPLIGNKLIFLALAAIGFVYHRKLMELFARGLESGQAQGELRVATTVLSLFFVFGNHFLWHTYAGHQAFALYYPALGLVYYCLIGFLRPLRRGEWAWGAALTWLVLTAGFYHTVVFFLLPFYLAFGASSAALLLVPRWRPLAPSWRALAGIASFQLAGAAASIYRLAPAMGYHHLHPRLVAFDPLDRVPFYKSVVFQIAPTLGFRYLFPGFSIEGAYAVWEHSCFTLNAWLLLAAAPAFLLWRSSRGERGSAFPAFVAAYAAVVFLFSLGNSGSLSLYAWINRVLFHQSLRVVGRFQIGFALAASMALAAILGRNPRVLRLLFGGKRRVALLALLGVFPFASFARIVSAEKFVELLRLKAAQPADRVEQVAFLPSAYGFAAMFKPTLGNKAVLNCYHPLQRAKLFDVPDDRGPPSEEDLPVVAPPEGASPDARAACIRESYLTQSRIHLSPACPPGTCVRINGLNPYTPAPSGLSPQAGRGYCLGGGP